MKQFRQTSREYGEAVARITLITAVRQADPTLTREQAVQLINDTPTALHQAALAYTILIDNAIDAELDKLGMDGARHHESKCAENS